MKELTIENLQDIIVRTLNHIDRRLTGHGERVAYGTLLMLKEDPRFSYIETFKIIWTILLHDIGIFHNMANVEGLLKNERASAFLHAHYGSFFLKYFSPYPEYAPIVYYHHSSREDVESACMSEKMKWACKYMQALDAADLYCVSHPEAKSDQLLGFLSRLSAKRYDKRAVDIIMGLVRKYQIPQNLILENVHRELLQYLKKMHVTEEEKAALLQTLVSFIDFRSHYTALHCAIMVHVSDMLGGLCGLDEETRAALHIGATLHDLGKIAIPVEILESPGKLAGKNWETMKSHVSLTEEILRGRVPDNVFHIAIRHHETLNGTGYPLGLNADSLDLPARIVAVADIVSALSEERSYKSAFPLDEVLQILWDMADSGRISPEVVRILDDNKEEIYEAAREKGRKTSEMYDKIYREYALSVQKYVEDKPSK